MKICDLHTHSNCSDGTLTPEEIVAEAQRLGLAAVVLCDHNTVAGLPRFLAAAQDSSVEAIPGVELTVDYNGTELHLVALYVKERDHDRITAFVEAFNVRKDRSNRHLIAALNAAGYAIDYETIKASTPNGHFNRARIAAELTRLGYVSSREEAFKTLLSEKAGYYVPPQRPDLWETLAFVLSLGAVPVLAHPLLSLDAAALEALLPEAARCGLVGMECYYSKYTEEKTQTALRLAQQYGILPSGGSDFHGDNKPGIAMGVGYGNLVIPYTWAQALKNAAR